MTRPSRVVVDIERIVIEGIHLDASGLDGARAAIVDGLTAWLTELDPTTLQSMTETRVAATAHAFDASPDGRALGRSVSETIRRVIDDGRAGCPSRPSHPSGDDAP